jgi:hypothetical protein
MARRFEVALTDAQYAFLDREADRSSVAIAELIRRAIDTVYGPDGDQLVTVISHELGRRSGRRLDRP